MPRYGHDPTPKQASVVILDIAVVIHMVRPTRAKVLVEYTSMHLLPFTESQKMPRTTRIDAVWDCYHKHSLKIQSRTKRQADGCIQRTLVSAKILIPRGKDWQQFLSINQNKDDLFKYLSTELISATKNNTACCMISTSGKMHFQINPLICPVLARQTTRRLTAGWCCIFSMLSWLVIRWCLSALLTQMLWYCQYTHSKTLV